MKSRSSENRLLQLLHNQSLADYCSHSRVHPLHSFPAQYYVKRDDELSFGIAGSKLRKYLSLIPALKAEGYKEAVLIGGASSNNIVGLSQLLIEEGIQPVLFLCSRKPKQASGNLAISELLVGNEHMHWHDKDYWPVIDKLAEEYAKSRPACCVIPEGASCADALPGALTLALDVVKNEQDLEIAFDHIVCDSGTGMMAAALILGSSILKRDIHHHVVLLAEDDHTFCSTLEYWKQTLEKLLGDHIPSLAAFTTYTPCNAKSFGSVNAGVKREIQKLAREEGILTDPIYSSKLFTEARNLSLKGNVLLIHSGSGLGSIVTGTR